MLQELLIDAPGRIQVYDRPFDASLQPGEFLVETAFSGISAGTELTFFYGTNPKTFEAFDPEFRMFRPVPVGFRSLEYPIRQDGLEVGVVMESRSEWMPVGSVIAAVYGHQSKAILNEGGYHIVLPSDLDPLLGIFVAKMGPICANAILYAADDIHRGAVHSLLGALRGQKVAVFGAGVVGLLTASLARWAGALDVMVVDAIPERLKIAEALGLAGKMISPEIALAMKERWKNEDPFETGADISFQCTASDELLAHAFRGVREQGTVIDLGFYQDGANNVFLGKEFHHNNLRHICAQITAVPRRQRSHWTRRILAYETVEFLKDWGDLFKKHVITHVVPFSQGQEIYEALAKRDPSVLQVALVPGM